MRSTRRKASYEDDSAAYHYGAKMGQDVRYRDRQ
jgi:hypothetical protein